MVFKKIKVRTITFLGLYVAIFLLMTFVPQIGYIKIGPINATMMAIPVALSTIHYGWKGAIFGLTCFALSSLLGCIVFQPPIVALGWGKLIVIFVIGRMLIFIPLILVIWIGKIIKNKNKEATDKKKHIAKYIYALIIGLTISIFNTIFCGLLIYAFYKDSYTFVAFVSLIAINISIEWTVPPTIAMALATLGFYLEHKEKVNKDITY
ncbi:ECF transporter S component [Mycoplasma marinum]|uniref:ECF transporter S component n=1 Tax=Mycoplasma marinum TaxID=1937190 RepID=A0A4R0XQJ3_9MOLU|nr:ECF transporter S component [Mycoplasma marinum]TCG11858.1 hypothetical protein C4B24_00475 [Mycoplasma marinum]